MTKDEIREIVATTVHEVLNRKEELKCEELDARYKDVKLLMRNYRKLKKYQDKITAEVLKVESIGIMKNKTDLIMHHVNKMLSAYKALCQAEQLIDKRRRWQALYFRYIADDKMRVDDIAKKLMIDRRTLYRDIEKAIADMSVLLFGIEALGTW